MPVTHYSPGPDGTIVAETKIITVDEGPRPGTTPETLAKLKPVFKKNGTVTAGNSSQTSDGAGMTVMMTAEKASAARPQAAGPLRQLRLRRRGPGRHGHRPDRGHPQGLQAGRASPSTTST